MYEGYENVVNFSKMTNLLTKSLKYVKKFAYVIKKL
jgi:hypothetical protein